MAKGKKEGYLSEWKGLEKKFGRMGAKRKLKRATGEELERQKENLRKFDEEGLSRIWGGKIPLKGSEK